MEVKKYRDREPQPFRAVQYDRNAEDIVEFTKGAARIHINRLYLMENNDEDLVELIAGDWVIEGANGLFYLRYDALEFEEDFEEV